MSLLKENKGTVLIETTLVMVIWLFLLFLPLEIFLLGTTQRLISLATYETARLLLPLSFSKEEKEKRKLFAQERAISILQKIPLRKNAPKIQMHETNQEVTVKISQEIGILRKTYSLYETLTLHR